MCKHDVGFPRLVHIEKHQTSTEICYATSTGMLGMAKLYVLVRIGIAIYLLPIWLPNVSLSLCMAK